MNIKIQISLVILIVTALAYYDKIPLREVSPKGDFIRYQNEPQKISISVKIPTSRVSTNPSKLERQPAAVISEVGLVPRQIVLEEFKIDRDLELSEDIQNDLLFLFSINQREKDFLLNEVRVSPEKYQQILNRKKLIQWQLSQAPQYAKAHGYHIQEVKKVILSKYVYWMQSTIGVGYYDRLQELAMTE